MDLEHLLTEEDRQIREVVRDFTGKEIIPNTLAMKKVERPIEKPAARSRTQRILVAPTPTSSGKLKNNFPVSERFSA